MEFDKSRKIQESLGKERKIKIGIMKEKEKYTEEVHSVLQDVKSLKLQSTLDRGEQNKTQDVYLAKELLFKFNKKHESNIWKYRKKVFR